MENERVIPLTPPGGLWSQREYVECMRLSIGFFAQRYGDTEQAFHYKFPDCCTTVIVGPLGIVKYIDHDFVPGIDWLQKCRKALP